MRVNCVCVQAWPYYHRQFGCVNRMPAQLRAGKIAGSCKRLQLAFATNQSAEMTPGPLVKWRSKRPPARPPPIHDDGVAL